MTQDATDFSRRAYMYDKYSNPVLHASTHEPGGTDPITLGVEDLGGVDVTGAENGSELVYDTTGITPVWRIKNRVHVRAQIKSPSAFTSGVDNLIVWDTIDYQSESVFDGEVFTVPYDDYYTFSFSLHFDQKIWLVGEDIEVVLKVNGTDTISSFFIPQAADSYYGWVATSDHIVLQEDDEVEVYVRGTYAGTLIPSAEATANFISIHN